MGVDDELGCVTEQPGGPQGGAEVRAQGLQGRREAPVEDGGVVAGHGSGVGRGHAPSSPTPPRARTARRTAQARGRRSSKRVGPCGRASTSSPPTLRAIRRAMARPRPAPDPPDEVVPGAKTSSVASSMPGPSSSIATRTSPGPARRRRRRPATGRSARRSPRPGSGPGPGSPAGPRRAGRPPRRPRPPGRAPPCGAPRRRRRPASWTRHPASPPRSWPPRGAS